MKSISRKRPSAAMIVAVVALSLGLGGSAIAGSGVLTKKQVKTVAKTVANKQITKRAPGLAVASAKSADTAGRATNVHSANVDADGTLLGSVPAGATSQRVGAGTYRVTFTRGVAGCLISSSIGGNDGAINPGSTGAIPATGENPNRVAVATFNNAGAVENRDFYVQMVCP
jgi:hypothetical protein